MAPASCRCQFDGLQPAARGDYIVNPTCLAGDGKRKELTQETLKRREYQDRGAVEGVNKLTRSFDYQDRGNSLPQDLCGSGSLREIIRGF